MRRSNYSSGSDCILVGIPRFLSLLAPDADLHRGRRRLDKRVHKLESDAAFEADLGATEARGGRGRSRMGEASDGFRKGRTLSRPLSNEARFS